MERARADADHVSFIGQIAKRIFIISRDITGRADRNVISDALAGAFFASQTGIICRVYGRLTRQQPCTSYCFIINYGRNIWDFWHVETSSNLWFTHSNHHQPDPV